MSTADVTQSDDGTNVRVSEIAGAATAKGGDPKNLKAHEHNESNAVAAPLVAVPAPEHHEHDAIHPTYSIVVEPPDTAANFTAFNIPCDVLDSDFLMQPVNEADYDSETQACVDKREGKVASFYDHYVTKRRKKKGMKGCGIESPAGHHKHPKRLGSAVAAAATAEQNENSQESHATVVLVVPSPSAPSSSAVKTSASHLLHVDPAPKHLDSSHLMAPSLLGTTSGVERGALCNAAVRRIACGRMPPPPPPDRCAAASSSPTTGVVVTAAVQNQVKKSDNTVNNNNEDMQKTKTSIGSTLPSSSLTAAASSPPPNSESTS